MAVGQRAAVHVDPLAVDLGQVVQHGQHHRGERLVDLPQRHVLGAIDNRSSSLLIADTGAMVNRSRLDRGHRGTEDLAERFDAEPSPPPRGCRSAKRTRRRSTVTSCPP